MSVLVQKVRRLTIRFRNRPQVRKATGEIGVTAVIATREDAKDLERIRVKQLRRKRSTVIVRKDAGICGDGQILPAATPIERLVTEARERVLLLSRQSGTGVAQPSVLGRLAATGEVSRRQYEAGARYAEIVREHDDLLARSVADTAAVEHADEGRRREGYRAAMSRYDRCRLALREAGREDRMAAAVVDAVAVSNWELPDLTPSLRIGLNHLARLLEGFDGEARAPVTPPAEPG